MQRSFRECEALFPWPTPNIPPFHLPFAFLKTPRYNMGERSALSTKSTAAVTMRVRQCTVSN